MELYPPQIIHVNNLVTIFNRNNRVLDASPTGLGKTICIIKTCKAIGKKPFIICPKSVISSWEDTLEIENLDYYGISTLELVKNCKFQKNNIKTKIPWLHKNPKYNITEFPKDMVIIIDEAHNCSNVKTISGQLLVVFSYSELPIILASATIATEASGFVLFGLCLKLYPLLEDGENYIIRKCNVINVKNYSLAFNTVLFPDFASKMNIEDFDFPENIIRTVSYIDDDDFSCNKNIHKEIENNYQKLAMYKIKQHQNNRYNEKSKSVFLKEYGKMEENNELLRIDFIIPFIKKMQHTHSIVIFVNYTESIRKLQLHISASVISGNDKNRPQTIKDFQSNKTKIIICMSKCAAAGISLHDIDGNYPRIALHMPTWHITNLLQAFGRICRLGGKSICYQYIIVGECEKYIKKKMMERLNNISLLNNGIKNPKPIYSIENILNEVSDCHTNFGSKNRLSKTDKKRISKKIYENSNKCDDEERQIKNLFAHGNESKMNDFLQEFSKDNHKMEIYDKILAKAFTIQI